ncbi:hypothetical protein RHSIM_Rhsim08G0106600 [Rhododendron simsii]|uniref:Zinc-finger domain-containing protein n=1 Tax=Rhododendron simsii TaxID=118357 RepID=A0A834LH80_RHOSS|nr:hypothetical protein RHSIM_Rhsim08G0106600 [Rhododendron simsii]
MGVQEQPITFHYRGYNAISTQLEFPPSEPISPYETRIPSSTSHSTVAPELRERERERERDKIAMVTLRNAKTLETPANPTTDRINENGHTQIEESHKKSDYEQAREQRIKENRERMEKLGIFDLSLKFKSAKPARNNSLNGKPSRCLSPLPPRGPTRRSSRLQNATPVVYSEVEVSKKNRSTSLEDERDLLGEGSKPEVYTDEHENLLGNTERNWTLFVDGIGQDGKRIYDPVKGKTCHQCRQKTLGHRTHCSKCGMVQGQFCGDCLYMRYGEHVLEANQNPDWICPVCRGICNCSLCRQAKGWPPTGALYRKISQLGFKSVAHYLIQTQRSQPDSDKNSGTKLPASSKKSLVFSEVEATSEGSKLSISNDENLSLVTTKDEENKTDDKLKGVKIEETGFVENEHGDSDIASKSSQEPDEKSALTSESSESELEGKKEEKLQVPDYKHSDNHVPLESSPKLKRKSPHPIAEPTPDSIGGRLRQRRRTGNGQSVLVETA